MKFRIILQLTTPDGETRESDIAVLDKGHAHHEEIGLSIEEGKELLVNLQDRMVAAQAEAFCASRSFCPCCRRRLRRNGALSIRYRTVFGDIPVTSPRYYRCSCNGTGARTFSPLTALLPDHVAPELLWLEAKWASLVSFGVTVGLLRDVLPVGAGLNAETVRSHLHRIAKRMEDELADEKVSCIQSSQRDRAAMPVPEGPITVGLDGGYVRSCSKGQPHFEVIVGKSIPANRPDRYIGLVQSHDTKPRQRLHDVLKDQGWQENQPVTFMTDGADTVRNLTRDMAPAGEHLLDWFHITMRITVMGQYVKGLSHPNPDEGAQLGRLLRRIKGYLWHGNLHGGQRAIDDLLMDVENLETDYPGINALRKAAGEFRTYIENNASMIPNYAERHRYGERVSTGFVESTVNTVVGKRFCKRQQMQWSKSGAHLMLQTRARTLDGTLRQKFEHWYPGMKHRNRPPATEKCAA